MCDTFCIRRPGGLLFAKASDRPFDEVQLIRWFGRRPAASGSGSDGGAGSLRATYISVPDAGAAALLGSQPAWMWGLEHGVNEHRVAIGNEKVWTVDDPREAPPALLGMDLVRLGLERGRTADAAVDAIVELLEAHGQGGSGEEGRDEPYWSSFLVVDPDGGWVVETSGRTWVAAPVGDGAAISNRLTLGTEWVRSSADVPAGTDWDRWRDPAVPTGIADHRLAATRACVARGSAGSAVGPREAVAVLRDHGTGPWGAPGAAATGAEVVPPPADVHEDWSGITVCMHVQGYQCTTAAMVADLPADPTAPVRVWASVGSSCATAFLPVALLGGDVAVVPAALGDEEVWRAAAAVARAVEQPGEAGAAALAAARAALGPVEAGAWDEADELWASGAREAAWRAAAERWDERLRAALLPLAQRSAAG